MLDDHQWPRSGARVRVVFSDGMSVGAAVLEVDAASVEMTVRANAHRARGTEGTTARLEWNTDTSHVSVRGTVTAVEEAVPLRCTVRFEEPARSIQRRSYVRLPMSAPLPTVRVTSGQTLEEGLLVDIAEAGMRVRVPEEMGLASGDLVHVDVELAEKLHELPSKVVRVLPAGPRQLGAKTIEQVELGLRFEENDDIRRWVLAEQLRRRNRD